MFLLRDKKEFRKVYEEFYPFIFGILYYRLRNKEDAEDISQEVFVRFFKNFNKIENFRAWLVTAMNYEITNYYRKKGNTSYDNIDPLNFETNSSYVYEDGCRETILIIRDAIHNMNNFSGGDEKTLFDLIAIQKYSLRQAARFLGLSKAQVEYKYRKALRRITDYLKEQGIYKAGDLL